MNVPEGACRDFARALQLEWWEANGRGGYAAGTVAGPNTRRYHGLLVVSVVPPLERRVLISRFEDAILGPGGPYPLCANIYDGALHPQGYRQLVACRTDPVPTFVYELPVGTVTRRVAMLHGQDATIVSYELQGGWAAMRLQVRPLISCRDHHHLVRATEAADPTSHSAPPVVWWAPWGEGSEVGLRYPGSFRHDPVWYYNFVYPVERERGLDYMEDLLSPGTIECELGLGETVHFVLFAGPPGERLDVANLDAAEALAAEGRRRAALPLGSLTAGRGAMPAQGPDPRLEELCRNADSFLVRRGDGLLTVIAGYPWFGDWGRDTMIALPGLTLALGRHAEARELLTTAVRFMDGGLVPNRFPEGGEPAYYNTIDATLWLFRAAEEYVAATGDTELVRETLYRALVEAVEWHLRGTGHGIHADADGLLAGGEAGDQLTWMDAKVGDWVFTPRHGKPVEIQGLWIAALRTLAGFAEELGRAEEAARYAELARRAQEAFARTFWDDEHGYLCDCVADGERDWALRPNQLIALAVAPDLLPPPQVERCLAAATAELLTPFGLRTLAPSDPLYRGQYGGDVGSRDSAYHQGTVWPWLLGPYVDVFCAVHGCSEAVREQATELLQPLLRHAGEFGLGSIAEVFDGDAPHRPGGCPAQAWSVAEVLRVAFRYGLCGLPAPGRPR